MHLFINEIHKILTSKQMFDFVYLVMMIIVVSIIKDMVVSLYKKRNEKRRLKELFRTSTNNTNQRKTVEQFTTSVEQPTDTSTLCNKLKYFLNEDNFKKFLDYIENHDKLFGVSATECGDTSGVSDDACTTKNLDKLILIIDKLVNTRSSYLPNKGNTKLDALYDLIDNDILFKLKGRCGIVDKNKFTIKNIHSIEVKHIPYMIQFGGDVKIEGGALQFVRTWKENNKNKYEYTHRLTPTNIHFLCRSTDAKIIKHGLEIEDRVRGEKQYENWNTKYGNAELPPLPSLLNDVVYIKTDDDTCMTLENTDASDARDVRMEPCNNYERQKWIVSNITLPGENKIYKEIRHKQNPDLCLDYDGGTCRKNLNGTYSDTGCSAYEIRECNLDDNRLFEFTDKSDMIPDNKDSTPMIKTMIKPKREDNMCIRYRFKQYKNANGYDREDIVFGKAECTKDIDENEDDSVNYDKATEFIFEKAS